MKNPAMKTLSIILACLITIMIGNGLISTLTPLTMQHLGWPTTLISLIAAINFIGLIVGALHAKKIIAALHYRNGFAGFACLIALTTLLQGSLLQFWHWLILRFINGYSLSAIYIIIESWLLSLSSQTNRNRILAGYLTSFYAATAAGQFLLQYVPPWTFQPYLLASLLSFIAIVAIYLIKQPPASIMQNQQYLSLKSLYQLSAIGMIGCLLAGMILGIFYSFAPLLFPTTELKKAAGFMGYTILGGTLGQLPIGWLADRLKRSAILLLMCGGTILISALLINSTHYPYLTLYFLAFIFGSCSFTLYPLSMSYAIQRLAASDYLAATGSLILIYSIGTAIGPFLAGTAMKLCGTNGIFLSEMILGIILAVILLGKRKTL